MFFPNFLPPVQFELSMPTNECSKGGELLATGQLSNSSPNHDHTDTHKHIQHYFRQANTAMTQLCLSCPVIVSLSSEARSEVTLRVIKEFIPTPCCNKLYSTCAWGFCKSPLTVQACKSSINHPLLAQWAFAKTPGTHVVLLYTGPLSIMIIIYKFCIYLYIIIHIQVPCSYLCSPSKDFLFSKSHRCLDLS